ncbi:YciI family protein [Zavarzinia sp. CC-PAN008]|uniref:YciI family protein n=1 Tax=Zavarzinia sp. CC-PAN008 TaxID=3243332 RepID=UPI003F749C10
MRVMVLVKATADSERGFVADALSQAMMAAMGRFNEDLERAGILLAGDGLKPTSAGVRVAFDGPARRETMGPFGPPGDQVAGYWLWQVKAMDEAVAWVRRCPNPMPGPSEIEIRPLYEAADLA